MMSGTSMAAAHVAGVVALVKNKFPWFTPAAIASAISRQHHFVTRMVNPLWPNVLIPIQM